MSEATRSTKPIHPAIVCAVYLMGSSTVVLQVYGVSWGAIASHLGMAAVFTVHVVWCAQSIRWTARGEAAGRVRTRNHLLAAAVVCGLVIVASYALPVMGVAGAGPFLDTLSSMAGAAIAISFFALNWVAAAALCTAEDGTKPPANRIFGTFLLFFYLVLGAFFLYRRMMKLGDQGLAG